MTRPLRLAFVFIVQSGRLETQAAVLAASLKTYCPRDALLFAAIPGPAPLWPGPSEKALQFLSELNVRFVPVINQIDPAYAIGNKIGCLSIEPDADKLVFLDSDMLLMRPWESEPRLEIAFNARPAAAPSFSADDADWDLVYRACNAKPLAGKICTTYTRQFIAPYFNSAFVAVPTGIDFGAAWLECCRAIDAAPGIPSKRPYLDQIALSPAISKLGLAYDCLDERFNHPINFKPMQARRLPLICHYHEPLTLAREPAAVANLAHLRAQHPTLGPLIDSDAEWSPVGTILRKGGASGAGDVPELLITGIPRSGTSFLCNLLHRLNNCVILNEPDEIGPALETLQAPWAVARFFRDIRREVLLGKPIRNKLVDGRVVEDTTISNVQIAYTPSVVSSDFVLGVKTTVPFLSRLESLRQVMPAARVVACVRNPFDAIASWKSSFAHLAGAQVDQTRIGNPRDPWLSGVDRANLESLTQIEHPAWRRAAWWRYLAERVLSHREHLVILKYEELVADPAAAVATILQDWNAGAPREAHPRGERAVQTKRHLLDDDDISAIRALCSDAATELGVYRASP